MVTKKVIQGKGDMCQIILESILILASKFFFSCV